MHQQSFNSGLGHMAGAQTQLSNQAINRAEIDAEVARLQSNIERLGASLEVLGTRLYQVLSPASAGTNGATPQPVLSSPLGNALHTESDRLIDLAMVVESLTQRIQL